MFSMSVDLTHIFSGIPERGRKVGCCVVHSLCIIKMNMHNLSMCSPVHYSCTCLDIEDESFHGVGENVAQLH